MDLSLSLISSAQIRIFVVNLNTGSKKGDEIERLLNETNSLLVNEDKRNTEYSNHRIFLQFSEVPE